MHIAPVEPYDGIPPQEDEVEAAARRIGRLAHRALLAEVTLTPKPGLVDRRNTGAHRDMDLALFLASARAVAPWFRLFFRRGVAQAVLPPAAGLGELRRDGLACEAAMFAATGGVNTHKGSIFAFGLLCAAAGRLFGQGRALDRHHVCAEVAAICHGIVETDLGVREEAATAGERLFRRHGLTGARGEAASGFATVRCHALPAFARAHADSGSARTGMFAALVELLAVNQDTNLVWRGGLAGLAHVQERARRLRAAGAIGSEDFLHRLESLDDDLIDRWLSPGGTADLLAVTWFLAHL